MQTLAGISQAVVSCASGCHLKLLLLPMQAVNLTVQFSLNSYSKLSQPTPVSKSICQQLPCQLLYRRVMVLLHSKMLQNSKKHNHLHAAVTLLMQMHHFHNHSRQDKTIVILGTPCLLKTSVCSMHSNQMQQACIISMTAQQLWAYQTASKTSTIVNQVTQSEQALPKLSAYMYGPDVCL